MRVNASLKSLAPIEVYQSPEQYRETITGKKIEELWGEGKELHGLRRFSRQTLEHVRQETYMLGWLLNLKRLTTLQAAV